jgi:hypothetical protein
METKRDIIIKKIQLLKNKTTDNGCSEAEALTATQMISKLLMDYDLSMSDVEAKSQEFISDIIELDGQIKKPIHDLVYSIGVFTDTKPWFKKANNKFVYTFFGAKKDVEFANYLFSLLSNSMDFEYKKYQKTTEYKLIGGRIARSNFFKGMVSRLSQRLLEMKKSNDKDLKEAGLILYNKMGLVNEQFTKLNLRLGKSKTTRTKISDYDAYLSGGRAANNVSINTGISNTKSKTLRLN